MQHVIMGVKQILDEWLIFRRQCIKRQCAYDLEKKREKHHLLTGLSGNLDTEDSKVEVKNYDVHIEIPFHLSSKEQEKPFIPVRK